MKKNKPRHNPEKQQNQYGGDYDCDSYDETADGKEWCHDVGHDTYWAEYVRWWKTNNNGELLCKGNRHNCQKERLKWLASLPVKKREKYKKRFDKK